MLRLRNRGFSNLLSSAHLPSASSIPSLHHLCHLTAGATSDSPGFVVEDYLVANCGLTRPQALKASTKLSYLTSPSRPDAVLAFLRGLGLSNSDVAVVVAKDPQFLCASVDKTLACRVTELTNLGLSRSDIARLIPAALASFRGISLSRNFGFWLSFFHGSFDKLLQLANKNYYLLGADLDKKVKPNIALLQECGLDACDIGKLCFRSGQKRLLTNNPDRVRMMVACAEGVGMPRGSAAFSGMLRAVGYRSEEETAARVKYLKDTLSWSHAEMAIAVSKHPSVLGLSKDMLRRMSHYLITEVGLEPVYIAHHPQLLSVRLEGVLRPRHCVIKFLKLNGLLRRNRSYNTIFRESKKRFAELFIHPHEEAAPGLARDYAAACRGEVPTRFIFA